MEHGYKSFICYRLTDKSHPSFVMSENVGSLLHYLINIKKDKRLDDVRGALFQEATVYREGVDWSNVTQYIPGCEYFFIALCPDFFEPFLSECREERKNTDPDKICEKIISGKIKFPVACKELLCAMSHTHVRICPIHVKSSEHGNVLPDEEDRRLLVEIFAHLCKKQDRQSDGIEDLVKIFKSKFDSIFTRTNILTILHDQMPDVIKGDTKWYSYTPVDDTVSEYIETEEVSKMVKSIEEMLVLDPSDVIGRWRDDADSDLERCFNLAIGSRIPRREARRYSALDDEIVYDPFYINRSYLYPQLPYSLVKSYRGAFVSLINCGTDQKSTPVKCYKTDLGLSSHEFSYWPVDLSRSSRENADYDIPKSISVCAVCFGTLICYHYLLTDERYRQIGGGRKRSEAYASIVRNGLNMLIALRSPDEKQGWPSQWKIENGEAHVIGNINQSTLSLSTLMSCGFLMDKCPASEQEKIWFFGTDDLQILKNRHQFIKENITCLLSIQKDTLSPGWSYSLMRTGEDQILPTCFVFDTLIKYYKCLDGLANAFSDDADYLESINDERAELAYRIHSTVRFFANNQHSGGFKKGRNLSITHTSYVIKSLHNYLMLWNKPAREEDIDTDKIKMARDVIEKASEYLLTELESRSNPGEWRRTLKVEEQERSEKFQFDDIHSENYEHCAELIVAETLIKTYNYFKNNDPHQAERSQRLLIWLAAICILSADRESAIPIAIKSNLGTSEWHPIYYVYYYRMFVSDFTKLLKENPDFYKKRI